MSEAVPAPATRRRALLLLAAIVALTNVAAFVVTVGWPAPDAEGRYTYAVLEPMREYARAWMIFAAANLVVGVSTLAVAGWLLVPRRGSVAATVGVALMWGGCALYAAGVGVIAGAFYFATEPAALDAAASARLLDHLHESTLSLWGPAIAGALLVAVGQVLLGVGLWRARTVPRWIPVCLWLLLLSFPLSGRLLLLASVPVAAGGLGVAWYLWRAVPRLAGEEAPAAAAVPSSP